MRIEVELTGDDDETAALADALHDWIESVWPEALVSVSYGCQLDSVAVDASGARDGLGNSAAILRVVRRIREARAMPA